jgi:PII-like signaling protein
MPESHKQRKEEASDMTNAGRCLRFYVHSEHYREGRPLYEWILEEAKRLNVQGGTCFKAMLGFGRHGRTHENRVVGAPADFVPVVVEFFLQEAEIAPLKAAVAAAKVEVFVAEWAAEYQQM